MDEYMLTTIDNPYNPFTQWDDWFNYDEDAGYHTCSYLDRIARTSDSMSETELQEELTRAMDEIIDEDPFGLYFKMKEGDTPNLGEV